MAWLSLTIVATAVFPLFWAWRANRRTTLLPSVYWAAASWAAWLLTLTALALRDIEEVPLCRHLALTLTGCAGVAVLGARRPGVGAWNFVVCGLLVVLLMPLAQGPDTAYQVFLGTTLAIGLTNYLPTRAGLGTLLIGVGCGLMFAARLEEVAGICLGLGPWLAWLMVRPRKGLSEADAIWLSFRDRFGVVWGQRVREQMNRAAANAGWPLTLGWFGFEIKDGATIPEEAVSALRALMKRFEIDDEPNSVSAQSALKT